MSGVLVLQILDPAGQVLVSHQKLSKPDKNANNLDAGANRNGAIEDIRCHESTVLSKGTRGILEVLSPL